MLVFMSIFLSHLLHSAVDVSLISLVNILHTIILNYLGPLFCN